MSFFTDLFGLTKAKKNYNSDKMNLVCSIQNFNQTYSSFNGDINKLFNQFTSMSLANSSFGISEIDEFIGKSVQLRNKYNSNSNEQTNLILQAQHILALITQLRDKNSSEFYSDKYLALYFQEMAKTISPPNQFLSGFINKITDFFATLSSLELNLMELHRTMYEENVPTIGRKQILTPEFLVNGRLEHIGDLFNSIFPKTQLNKIFVYREYFQSITTFFIEHKLQQYNLQCLNGSGAK